MPYTRLYKLCLPSIEQAINISLESKDKILKNKS